MCNLDKYVEKVKQYIEKNPGLTENEIIMYVYLDLGERFNFEQEVFFGGNKKRKSLYTHAHEFNELNKCMESNRVICKSASYILEYILKKIGINVESVIDEKDIRKYKHVYNIIKPKDGSEAYSIDLQADIINIHYHSFTRNFGRSLKDSNRYVIDRKSQEKIHRKLGYISREHPYTDEYIYLFKQDFVLLNDFYSKLDLVLQNIDPIEYKNVGYWERKWRHERFLKQLFPSNELSRKLHLLECYKENENKAKEYLNCFWIKCSEGMVVYLYSQTDNKYNRYSLPEFAVKVQNEGLKFRNEIRDVKREVRKLNNKKCLEER